jgi:transposase
MSLGTEQAQITFPPASTREAPIIKGQQPASYFDPSLHFDPATKSDRYPCPAFPFFDCPLSVQLSTIRSEKAYWRKMHEKALLREATLKEDIAALKAKVRLRERQLFGRKSEKEYHQEANPSKTDKDKKPRGQQPGSKGHPRRNYAHLPSTEEIQDIPENQRRCPLCDLPYESFPGTEDAQLIEIEVKAYRRIIKRKRYKTTCQCGHLPGIITAPPAPKLIPKGLLGTSLWVTLLLDKFLFMRPTYRLLADLKTHGLDIAQGTLTDNLKTIAPLFLPIYDAIITQNLQHNRWHADETRWLVFATVEGKVGYQWYMWVFRSPHTVVYRLDKSRCAEVPKAHFGIVKEGILVVDRYAAYKAMAKHSQIILAFCWAHVRRDFLSLATHWPKQESWALQWVQDIGHLYHLNSRRLALMDHPRKFEQRNLQLKTAVDQMAQKRDVQLNNPKSHPACRKILESLKNHWEGLTVFVDHPEVPMDNNEAERLERKPVLGRKNFYGSGSLWSGQLTAMLLSIFQTLNLWHINPRSWLTTFLQTCATNHGQAPKDIQPFLPWHPSTPQQKAFSMKPPIKDSS